MSLVSDWNNLILLERENLATFLSFGDNSRIVILPGLQEENEGYVKSYFARHLYLPALGRIQRSLWNKKNRWEAQWWPGPGATMQGLWKNQGGPWGSNEFSYRVSVSKSWYYFLPGHMEALVSMARVCRDRKRRCPRKAQAQLSNQFHSRRSQKRKHIAWLCGWNPATAKGSLEI